MSLPGNGNLLKKLLANLEIKHIPFKKNYQTFNSCKTVLVQNCTDVANLWHDIYENKVSNKLFLEKYLQYFQSNNHITC